VALVTIGYITSLRGKPGRASALLRDGLQQLILARETIYLMYGLLACAGHATLQQQPLRAAALFGAGMRLAEHARLAFVQGVLELVLAHIEQARAQSDPEAFDRALQHGRLLSLDAAVAQAQQLLEETGGQLEVLEYGWADSRHRARLLSLAS
jgi:hypothetical protein